MTGVYYAKNGNTNVRVLQTLCTSAPEPAYRHGRHGYVWTIRPGNADV